jgi:DNA-binding transcriptional MerR regulator
VSRIYTAPALATASGVTLRQIQYWTNRGYIKPLRVEGRPQEGTGNTRLYGDQHIRQVRILSYLLDHHRAADIAVQLNERGEIHLPHGITLRLGGAS